LNPPLVLWLPFHRPNTPADHYAGAVRFRILG